MSAVVIQGKTLARFIPKDIIANPNGEVRKYLRNDSNNLKCFKEVYFSRLLPMASKKWKCNSNQSQNLTSAHGRISVICIQIGEDVYVYEEFIIDDDKNFGVLEIPPGIIYGLFTDLHGALVVNSLEENYSDTDAQVISETFNIEPALL